MWNVTRGGTVIKTIDPNSLAVTEMLQLERTNDTNDGLDDLLSMTAHQEKMLLLL